MSNSFFERNKRKSSLALLLLLIPRARSTVVVVLLVVMFAFFLFGAKSMGMPIPWADKLIQRVATNSDNNGLGMARLGELAKLFQGSGASTRSFRGLWGGRGVIASYEQRDSSVKMVKGIDLSGKGGSGEGDDLSGRLPKAGRGTNGVPTPDDAQKMDGGVPLNENELLSGLTKNANGNGAKGGADPRTDSVEMLKNALEHGSAISPGSGISFGAVHGASWGGGLNLGGFSGGSASGKTTANNGLPNVVACTSSACARHNLAEVKALACAASPPLGGQTLCNTNVSCPSGVCPGEFAYHTEDAPYSGGAAGGDILSMATEPVPVTPDAQTALTNEYADAAKDQVCAQIISGYQGVVENVNSTFVQCCNQVQSNFLSCESVQCGLSSLKNVACCLGIGCQTCITPAVAQADVCANNMKSTMDAYNTSAGQCPNSANNVGLNYYSGSLTPSCPANGYQ